MPPGAEPAQVNRFGAVVGHRLTAMVAGNGVVGGVAVPVGGSGIEKYEVHGKIKECGDLPEHLLGQLVFDLQ